MTTPHKRRDDRQRVMVTGGAGFIGSHTCVELIESGHDVIVVDNLSAGHAQALDRVREITGGDLIFEEVDVTDAAALDAVFRRHRIDAVIHFAARKAVGESTEIPLRYFHTNVAGTATLLTTAHNAGVNRIIFSSSCSIYGETTEARLDEEFPAAPTNPYAWTKLACENMIAQSCSLLDEVRAISLRYFNPIGAHPSGLIGEDPKGRPRNIVPYITRVASGILGSLQVFGGDYPTLDGTAVRDYVHVVDIARGHVLALDHIDDSPNMQVFNLGTGHGYSVLQLLAEFRSVVGREIPYVVTGRRAGDVPQLVADASAVGSAWGWHAQNGLHEMCRDSWLFQVRHPNGYV